MKKVEGWLTEDDTFFYRENDAEVYESELALRQACNKLEINGLSIDDDKVINVVISLEKEVLRYLAARHSASVHPANNGKAEEPEAVLEQPVGELQPMPHVRRRSRPEAVR